LLLHAISNNPNIVIVNIFFIVFRLLLFNVLLDESLALISSEMDSIFYL